MKHAASGIVGFIVAAGLAASCGSLPVNGTGSPSQDITGPDASIRCGGSGEACCNQTACNGGLTCTAGTCSSASQVDATRDASQDEDSSADGPATEPTDSSTSPDVGDEESTGVGGDGGIPDAESSDGADAQAEAGPPVCVASAAACMTANPGACGPGTSACGDAGAPVCRPIQTTQACYTGAAGTRGVGKCKDGTQSCIGTLGACKGEVLPAAHDNCFTGTDDDCNGAIGNSCPQALTIGADRALAAAGGTGGAASTVHCPKGAFVTRVDSWFDDIDQHVSGVSIYCAVPSLVQGASSYSVTLTPSTPSPYQKAAGVGATDERTDDCGTTGLSAITSTTGLADTYVEGIGNHCGTSAVTLAGDNTITFSFVPSGDTSYNAWSNSTGNFFDEACNSNEVIVGFALHIGGWLFNIKPICAALQVTYK
jgi:hypothetical protein